MTHPTTTDPTTHQQTDNRAAWLPASKARLHVAPAPCAPPGTGEILVANRAVAINPVDWIKQVLGGAMFPWIRYPFILGSDLAGEVIDVGPGVTRFRRGDRVLAHAVWTDKKRNRPGALRCAPARFVHGLRTAAGWHRPLVWFALLMLAWGAVSLIGYLADPRLLAGVRIWAKPVKFTISLAIYAVTLAWLISLIDKPRLRRVAWWAGTLGAVSSLLEISVITVQVVRGTSSHFNVSTPVDATMYALMGSGVVFLYGAALVIGVLLLISSRIRDRSLIWALRLGLLIGVAGLSVGFLMVRPTPAQTADFDGHIGSHSVGGDISSGLPFLGWNTAHGDLRVPHFIGMHALQLLPLLALTLAATYGERLPEGTRLRIVLLAAAAYASVTSLTLWQALRGQSIVHPDLLTLTTAGVLTAIGAVCAVTIGRRVRHDLATHDPGDQDRSSQDPAVPVVAHAGRKHFPTAPHR